MATSQGYLVYIIRMNEPHRASQLHRLSSFGDSRDLDLLDLAEKSLASIRDKYVKDAKSAEGYRLREVTRRNRTLFIQVNKGPHSVGGEAYETVTGNSVDIPNTTAMLNRMRAMIAIPENAYYGLLFTERHGNRNLKEVIKFEALIPNTIANNMTLHVDSFAQHKDWERLLRDQKALSLTEYLEITDTTVDGSTARTPIKLVAEGARVNSITKGVVGAINSRVKRREDLLDRMSDAAHLNEKKNIHKAGFSVSDQTELDNQNRALKALRDSPQLSSEIEQQLREAVPIHVDGRLEHKRFEVVTGNEQTERKFSVDRDSLPQFVYETSGILPDQALLDTWVTHAEEIFHARRVKIPTDWASR